jgi:hypothetical protein
MVMQPATMVAALTAVNRRNTCCIDCAANATLECRLTFPGHDPRGKLANFDVVRVYLATVTPMAWARMIMCFLQTAAGNYHFTLIVAQFGFARRC